MRMNAISRSAVSVAVKVWWFIPQRLTSCVRRFAVVENRCTTTGQRALGQCSACHRIIMICGCEWWRVESCTSSKRVPPVLASIPFQCGHYRGEIITLPFPSSSHPLWINLSCKRLVATSGLGPEQPPACRSLYRASENAGWSWEGGTGYIYSVHHWNE